MLHQKILNFVKNQFKTIDLLPKIIDRKKIVPDVI